MRPRNSGQLMGHRHQVLGRLRGLLYLNVLLDGKITITVNSFFSFVKQTMLRSKKRTVLTEQRATRPRRHTFFEEHLANAITFCFVSFFCLFSCFFNNLFFFCFLPINRLFVLSFPVEKGMKKHDCALASQSKRKHEVATKRGILF